MATKRSTQGTRKTATSVNTLGPTYPSFSSRVMDWASQPTVRYVAGGIAMSMLTRLANRISTKYPEISGALKEGIEAVEVKLKEFKDGLEGTPTSQGRKRQSIETESGPYAGTRE